jgi:NAD(P)-dependent dehydrogenase (short-subunit alcohol dehydrogenase family)
VSSARLNLDLRPTTALVTGATSAIGRSAALRLADDGYEVIVQGSDVAYGAAIVKEIRDAGGKARHMRDDLADRTAVAGLAGDVGAVDVLVSVAGFPWFGLAAAFAPRMAALGHGTIINVSTTAAGPGAGDLAVYGETRAALESMTRAWAVRLSPHGIRVNSVALAGADLPAGGEGRRPATPVNRPADMQIGDLISLLTSAGASHLTGVTVITCA